MHQQNKERFPVEKDCSKFGFPTSFTRNPASGFEKMENRMKKQEEDLDRLQMTISHLNQKQQQQQLRQASENETVTLPGLGSMESKLQEQLDQQKEKITGLIQAGSNGVVYVRWGRKDCPRNTTELVYSGYAGGSHYSNKGAAAEYVCLPPDPSWGPKQNIRAQQPGFMYGAEFEDNILFNVKDRNRDVPCAVCRSSNQSTSIMIPARVTCYPGWTEAYHGYLASGYYNQPAASQYVCVDQQPQTLLGGGSSNDDGKLFFQVRAKCGSLKCPPYEEDKVLSCVVCLK
ncbi:short-chain collagen C4-like [Pecten maximus]|uniref:short-chain collagen C4-like n=1 Tax=Pecten maximus TaxID=6579 RepID=UPI001458A302|nr:short-chain collagen C4-like [Pecten maximus]